ncbi:hypothetical protein D1007_28650 [Hordeum vulgare]|nr:hypothetical protein D1007_28650 [Hordeum vulgare]
MAGGGDDGLAGSDGEMGGEVRQERSDTSMREWQIHRDYHRIMAETSSDRLGKLPDEILVSILERLDDLRLAVRSSILSKRWRHLPGMIPHIDLDVGSFVKGNAEEDRHNTGLPQALESVLALQSPHSIQRLAVHFFLTDDDSARILGAVDDAVSSGRRRVTSVTLSMLGEKCDLLCEPDDMLRQATRLLSLLGAYPSAFAGLVDLHLESVRLDESEVPRLLGACGKLERLALQNCDSGLWKVLRLEHPRLRHLDIEHCGCKAVELRWLPRLERVTCTSWMVSKYLPPLLFGHVPELEAVTFTNTAIDGIRALGLRELVGDAAATIRELVLNFLNARGSTSASHRRHHPWTPRLENGYHTRTKILANHKPLLVPSGLTFSYSGQPLIFLSASTDIEHQGREATWGDISVDIEENRTSHQSQRTG